MDLGRGKYANKTPISFSMYTHGTHGIDLHAIIFQTNPGQWTSLSGICVHFPGQPPPSPIFSFSIIDRSLYSAMPKPSRAK